MKRGVPASFGEQLRAFRQAAGFTQEELATIAGLSVHAVSALERGERRRPRIDTVRALSTALELSAKNLEAFLESARPPLHGEEANDQSGPSLPLPLTPLLGRESDVRTLRHWLADPTARLVTLVGPGGVGKTRLALEIARVVSAEGATRVGFVALATAPDSAFVASATAEAFGLSDVTAANVPGRASIACADRPTLLVLDNFEHVLDAAPLVLDLVSSVASLRVLVTSRAPLRVRGEREYVVAPLALSADSTHTSLAEQARSPAVRLFVERVRAVQPDFRLTSDNLPTVTAICRRLDALPLALELAAPWLKVLAPQDLLRRLDHGVLLSTVGPRDLPERQQTMNATVAWSYQLLDGNEQRAFRRFGALPGLFSIDAAAAVLGGREGLVQNEEALAATARLIDKSLLLRAETSAVPTCQLYQMLETVRAYAALELTAAGERDDAMEGLVRYTTGEATLAAEGLVGPKQVEWLDRVREDLESYRAALTWLIEQGRSVEASFIAGKLMFFWAIRGHATEGLRWYEQISRLPSLPASAESTVLVGSALLRYTQGELGLARADLARARALADDAGDMRMVLQADHMLGHVEHAVGNARAARQLFARSVDGFRALSLHWAAGNALAGLAWVAVATGDDGQAERLLDEAAAALREAGPWFLLLTLYVRAILAVRRGDPDHAIALGRESLSRIRELHDKFAFVYALVPLAAAAVLKGHDAWAARILGARDAVTERTGATVVDTSVDDLKEEVERQVRARLGPNRWARAYAAGRRCSIDALLKDIDRVVRGETLSLQTA